MKLSLTERLILANQYRILEALYPNEASTYAQHRKVLEMGFIHQYNWIAEHFWPELSEERCKAVWDILEMHSALQRSYDQLTGKHAIAEKDVFFAGFDGNDEVEGSCMAYARFIVDDLQRYGDLKHAADMNSHMPNLPYYHRMLKRWQALERSHKMSADEIKSVLSAQ